MKNIFVGNLDFADSEDQLRALFTGYGTVESVTIAKDRDTAQPRGFAFIEMTQAGDAGAAIFSLDGTIQNGRALRVNEARPKLAHDANATHPKVGITAAIKSTPRHNQTHCNAALYRRVQQELRPIVAYRPLGAEHADSREVARF